MLGTLSSFSTEPLFLVFNPELGVELLGQGFDGIFGLTAFCRQKKFGALRGPERHQIEYARGIGYLAAFVDRHLCVVFPHGLHDCVRWPSMEAMRIGNGDDSRKGFCGHFHFGKCTAREKEGQSSFQKSFFLAKIALFS